MEQAMSQVQKTEIETATTRRGSWRHSRSGRLARSLIAWAVANPLGWVIGLTVFGVGNTIALNLQDHEGRSLFAGFDSFGFMLLFGCMISVPLTLVIGMPVQFLMQRRGIVSLWRNVLAAVVIGYPVGLVVSVVSNNKPLAENLAHLGDFFGQAAITVPFLVTGSIIFWLIRRPDRDGQLT